MRLGVLFDLDGTLVRVTSPWEAWREELRRALGVADASAAAFDSALDLELRRPGALTLALAVRRALATIGAEAPNDLQAVASAAAARHAAGTQVLPGARALLETARVHGAATAIVSNGPDDMQKAVLSASGLADLVDLSVVSGAAEVGVRKPHPKLFWLACTGLKVRPADALMVGDDLDADIEGARRFGLATCWLAPDGQERAARPGTIVVRDLAAAAQVVGEFVRH